MMMFSCDLSDMQTVHCNMALIYRLSAVAEPASSISVMRDAGVLRHCGRYQLVLIKSHLVHPPMEKKPDEMSFLHLEEARCKN